MSAEKIALFPGSFDPITYGHIEIVRRGLLFFDRIIIGVGVNTSKQPMFTAAQRMRWVESVFEHSDTITTASFSGLTVDMAAKVGAQFLLRGLRNAPDFEYERNIDLLNKHLNKSIETVYIISSPATAHISSTLVREVIRFRGELDGLVPPEISQEIFASIEPANP